MRWLDPLVNPMACLPQPDSEDEAPLSVAAVVPLIQRLLRDNNEQPLNASKKSLLRGLGLDFKELRVYQPGDDIRQLDWNVLARTGHPYVRQYDIDVEQKFWLVIASTPSLHFGRKQAKLVVLQKVLLILTALAELAGVSVGVYIIGQKLTSPSELLAQKTDPDSHSKNSDPKSINPKGIEPKDFDPKTHLETAYCLPQTLSSFQGSNSAKTVTSQQVIHSIFRFLAAQNFIEDTPETVVQAAAHQDGFKKTKRQGSARVSAKLNATVLSVHGMGAALQRFQTLCAKNSTVFFCADFLTDFLNQSPDYFSGLAQLSQRAKVIPIRLRDPADNQLPRGIGTLTLRNAVGPPGYGPQSVVTVDTNNNSACQHIEKEAALAIARTDNALWHNCRQKPIVLDNHQTVKTLLQLLMTAH